MTPHEAPAASPLNHRLVCDLRFDRRLEDGALDFSRYLRHATPYSGPSEILWVAGRAGWAARVDGSSQQTDWWFATPDAKDDGLIFGPAEDFTQEFLMRRVGTMASQVRLFRERAPSVAGYFLTMFGWGHRIYILWRDTNGNAVSGYISPYNSITDGKWSHIALRAKRASGRVECYINAEYQGYLDISGITGNLGFGGGIKLVQLTNPGNYVIVDLAYLRVYRRALTDNELRRRYEQAFRDYINLGGNCFIIHR